MKTKFNEFVNENKNLPNVFKTLGYRKLTPDYMSEKTYSFLINWTWNGDFLHYYQDNGVNAIDKDIVNELSKWKPNKTVELHRVICDQNEDSKFDNKLSSFFPTLKAAKTLHKDMNCKKQMVLLNL